MPDTLPEQVRRLPYGADNDDVMLTGDRRMGHEIGYRRGFMSALAAAAKLIEQHAREHGTVEEANARHALCIEKLEEAEALLAERQKFKDWVHAYLDANGVPHHPPGTHGEHGCRIGDRMDWLMKQLDRLRAERNARQETVEVLRTENVNLRSGHKPFGDEAHSSELDALREQRDTYSRAADYWWNAYHQAATGKVLDPRSSDPEQDRASRAMGQREHATQTLLADFVKWFDNWCPSNKCCAHTGLPLHKRAIALLKSTSSEMRSATVAANNPS